jgi:replication factor A1
MKINEISRGMNGISLKGKIVEKSDPRRVNTRYGERSVADAVLEDETGRIKLSLWEEKIEMINVGDSVSVGDAYVTEFRGELQLNVPRSGKIEVTEEDRYDLK